MIGALVLAAGLLGSVSVLQGPKLETSQLDAATAITSPGQQLRLIVNQAVAPVTAKQVTVAPKTAVSVQSQGDVVVVRFVSALLDDTVYRVAIAGVTSPRGGAPSTLHEEFRTPAFGLDYLVRTTSGDRIVHAVVGSSARTVLYQAAGIESFAPLSGALVVVRDATGGGSELHIVDTGGVHDETVSLPGRGTVDAVLTVGNVVLFTFSSEVAQPVPEFDRTLFRVDLTGTGDATPVLGLDKKPLTVLGWRSIPGTTSVVLNADGQIVRYDASGTTAPAFIGSYANLGGLSPDAARLGVGDVTGPSVLTVSSGALRAVPALPIAGVVPYLEEVVPLTATRLLARVALPAARAPGFDVVLALDDLAPARATSRVLYRPDGPQPGILSERVTANGRYVVIEVDPDTSRSVPDSGITNPRPVAVTTVVVDLATGQAVTEVAGFDPQF